MKIKIRFEHSRKAKDYALVPATFHYDEDCSTGPVIVKGTNYEVEYDAKNGDTIAFVTTKYADEPSLFIRRKGRIVNAPKDAPIQRRRLVK